MRAVTAFVYAALVAIATVALACDEASQVTLSGALPYIRLGLVETSAGETLRVCMDSLSGNGLDYYFTSTASAQAWTTAAAIHYSTTSDPYTAQPSVVYNSHLSSGGFTDEFDVSQEQADGANKDFSIILHATTSACTGSGNSCAADIAVHSITAASIVVLIILIAIAIAIIACIAGCIYCCCCRKQPEPQPVVVQQVPVQGQAVQGQAVQGQQAGGYPQQQQQPGGYPPMQQQPGGYPPMQQQPGGYPAQQPADAPADGEPGAVKHAV